MDIFSLKDDLGAWRRLIKQFEARQPISKMDIEIALAANGDIPEKAKPLIKQLVLGEYFFKQGKKVWVNEENLLAQKERHSIVGIFYDVEAILNGRLRNYFTGDMARKIAEWKNEAYSVKQGRRTPNRIAKTEVAELYGVKEKQMELWIAHDANDLAAALGITEEKARKVRRYWSSDEYRKLD